MKRFLLIVVAALAAPACASGPRSASEQVTMMDKAAATLGEMRARDPGIGDVVQNAYAYAVFPDVGKAGLIVGGSSGHGILYEHGVPTGNVHIEQASLGLQAGAQTFAELVVLRNQDEVNRLKAGKFDLGTNVSAVIIQTGAAATTGTARGNTVFVLPKGGAMIDVSVSGQRILFAPLSG
ncbi:MAG TPA: lipid-binding SYLF domain-containing protein [Kofleriaceae bacterium]|nr:lipid-binding SYLF domain-containing protein [Kofleriaceae bacterium]